MPPPRPIGVVPFALAPLGLLAAAFAPPARAPRLPPIVFVSRQPVPGDRSAVPGLGPHHRAIVTGGRLMLRDPDGTVRELAPGRFLDVQHPSVAPDGRRVLFSAVGDTTSRRARWHPYVIDLETGRVDPLVEHGRDVLQPRWIADSVYCFAGPTPGRPRAQYADVALTQICVAGAARRPPAGAIPASWTVEERPGGKELPGAARVTAERNGAESPAWDPTTGRIVFARWWYNRWRPSDDAPGLTRDAARSIARDTANLWQIVSVKPDGSDLRVEASGLASRREGMGYQPAVLADGSIVATYAVNAGLSPGPFALGIRRFAPRLGRVRRLVGAIVEEGGGYGSPRGLAAPAACAPAALPDGGILFSYAPGARGDFGLYRMDRDGRRIEPILDLPGALELDAAPVVRWRAQPIEPPAGVLPTDDLDLFGVRDPAAAHRSQRVFRFHSLDVFAAGHARPGVRAAPPRTPGTRIRFWATRGRDDGAPGDTAVLVHEAPVRPDGSVDEWLPADVPLFEQLVDAHGRILRSPDGPAHVAGFNSGRPGAEVRCVGCHVGHSVASLPRR